VKVYARGTDLDTFLPGVSAVLLSVLAGMTYISAPSISIEGKNLWIMMSTPIKAGDALLGKLLAHLVPAVPASLISSLLFMLAIRTNAEDSIIVFMMPLMANIFCAECGLITGLYSHRFDYPSDAKAVKSGSSYIIPMLATVALSLGPSILFFTTLGEQGISYETCILAATGLMLILNIGMFIYLRSPAAAAKWNKMGNE
jgi:ABC-2 type transport system permease protein